MSTLRRLIAKLGYARNGRRAALGLHATTASSIAEGDVEYVEICRQAANDSCAFANFRRDPRYTPILEHVSDLDGRKYFELLSRPGRAFDATREAARNDLIGNPALMELEPGLRVSPTTLRYLKVADDLEGFFGSLDGMRVIEIGVGYGGQCRILDSLHKLASYTLVDLKPVLGLAERFLSHFALSCQVQFRTMNELAEERFDLAISNYAFTELRRDVQEVYFRKVLAGAARGYITFNQIAPSNFDSMTREDLCSRVAGVTRPEVPLTHPGNCLVVWGPGINAAPPDSEENAASTPATKSVSRVN